MALPSLLTVFRLAGSLTEISESVSVYHYYILRCVEGNDGNIVVKMVISAASCVLSAQGKPYLRGGPL